ncbi:MAG: DUF6665 family protein [Pseudomonadota bacterium]
MQKFGLQRTSSKLPTPVEQEILKEQATSLGRAGRKLRLSLEKYERLHRTDMPSGARSVMFDEIANAVWELMLQREFVGFTEGNLTWVKDHYVIPVEALNQMGSKRT